MRQLTPQDIQYLRNLREVLADLFPEKDEVRTVVSDTGMDSRRVRWSDLSSSMWQNIIDEARKQHMIPAIIDSALHFYSNDKDLLELKTYDWSRLSARGLLWDEPEDRLPAPAEVAMSLFRAAEILDRLMLLPRRRRRRKPKTAQLKRKDLKGGPRRSRPRTKTRNGSSGTRRPARD